MPVPLFEFPLDIQQLIVKRMPVVPLCDFSILSKRSKRLVKSANIRMHHMEFRINGAPRMYISTDFGDSSHVTFRHAERRDWQRKGADEPRPRFELPMTVDIGTRHTFLETEKLPSFYLSHFVDIFHHTQGILVIVASDWFEPDTLKEAFKGTNFGKVEIHANVSDRAMDPQNVAHALAQTDRMAVYCDIFYPRSYAGLPKYYMPANPESETGIVRLMSQNFKALLLNCPRICPEHLSALNSQYFTNRYPFHPKEVRRFVKMWLQGCASRLKYISLALHFEHPPFPVLRGIEGVQVSDEVRREFTGINDRLEFETQALRGGYDIRRDDNTMATVWCGSGGFRMVVWQ